MTVKQNSGQGDHMKPEREQSIDIAKGFGILLVVFGHTIASWGGGNEILHRFVYSFHMPLFFAVSGMFISSNLNLISFIKSKFTRFAIPFLFWVLFYFFLCLGLRIAKLSLQGFVNVNKAEPILDLQTLKNLFIVPILANWSSIKSAGVYIDLWFLPAVFSTVILYRILLELTNRRETLIPLFVSTLFSFVVVWLNNKYSFHNYVPWSMDVAAVCLPFVIISKYRSYVNRIHWIAIPLFTITIYYLSKGMIVEVAGLKIGNYLKFFFTANCGIVLVLLVSAKLQKSWVGSVLSSIGKRTYLIFVLQGLSFTIFRPIFSRLPLLSTNELLFDSMLFLTTVLFGYVLYPVFAKYKHLRLISLGQ